MLEALALALVVAEAGAAVAADDKARADGAAEGEESVAARRDSNKEDDNDDGVNKAGEVEEDEPVSWDLSLVCSCPMVVITVTDEDTGAEPFATAVVASGVGADAIMFLTLPCSSCVDRRAGRDEDVDVDVDVGATVDVAAVVNGGVVPAVPAAASESNAGAGGKE